MHLEFLAYSVEGVEILEKRWDNFIQEVADKWKDLGILL
jgi:hypothetical protein